MKFSMKRAAREVAVSPTTMHRYIKTGKISADRLDDGSYSIDASELMRVFPPDRIKRGRDGDATLSGDQAEPIGTGHATDAETAILRAENKMLREMLERTDLALTRERDAASAAIEDYRRRLDQEGEERRALNLRLLAYQPPGPPDATPPGSLPPSSPADPEPSPDHPGQRGRFGSLFRREG